MEVLEMSAQALKTSGRPRHLRTKPRREVVEKLTAYGVTQDHIAREIGVCQKTLQTHYRDEIDLGTARAKVAGVLFEKAMSGDTACLIFWLKTRARWSEKAEVQQNNRILVLMDGPMSDEEFADKFCGGQEPIEIPFSNT
jgi:hypothetical protein